MEFTKENATKIINSREMIARKGYYEVKVTNNAVPFEDKFIVNLSAMTPYHLAEAKRLATEGKFQEATNQQLSHSLRKGDYIPSKGERVKAYIDEITTKNGITGLFVTSISELKAVATTKISFDLDSEIQLPANTDEAFTTKAESKTAKVTA